MLYTAESVTIAHPDKVCDQISDAILDACLAQDPASRVAIETMGGHGLITITGELTTKAQLNLRQIALATYHDCGYSDYPGITINVVEQSPEIAHGVDHDGAGDQGIMVGYATSATPESMPLAIVLSRRLTRAMGGYDGKAQVTMDQGKIIKILTSVCGTNAERDERLRQTVAQHLLPHLAPELTLDQAWLQNPNGPWDIGGFAADTGLTGRKLIIDNYGPNIPIGGGAFSGKDATKVDRSAAYMARKIAVDYLSKQGAREVFVHLAYAIGVAEPLMAVATIDGRQEKVQGYDLRPRAIIEQLNLHQPQFQATARYGHFGNGFAWDK
ncbi:MAG: methionine adenosyltransferase domain-containing protein [Candidatus Falkowbacteria bacterium]